MQIQARRVSLLLLAAFAYAQEPVRLTPSPDRRAGEGEGPFDRMVIRNITMIDGTGAPPRGPVDIVVEKNRIAEVKSVGYPLVPVDEKNRPVKGTKEIDGTGLYIMPGFIDPHIHFPQMQVVGSYAGNLLEWLNTYTFVEEQRFADAGHAADGLPTLSACGLVRPQPRHFPDFK